LCSKHPAFAQPYASHPIANGRSFGYQDSPRIDAENGVFSHSKDDSLLFIAVHGCDKRPVVFLKIKLQWNDHEFQAVLTLVALSCHETDVWVDTNPMACDTNSK
jgi:hypothetical protein